jgi:hypothetical protein
MLLHWPQFLALLGLAGTADAWTPMLEPEPVAAPHLALVLGGTFSLNWLPLAEALWRARTAGHASLAAAR